MLAHSLKYSPIYEPFRALSGGPNLKREKKATAPSSPLPLLQREEAAVAPWTAASSWSFAGLDSLLNSNLK